MIICCTLYTCMLYVVYMYMYIHVSIHADADDVDKLVLAKVLTLLQHCNPRDSIVYATQTGDISTLKPYLEKYPQEVCTCTYIRACTCIYTIYI